MNTTQAPHNGDQSFPPPCSVENPAELNSAGLPANKDDNNHFRASAYHVPPNIYVPKAHAYRHDDYLDNPHLSGPLPDRCQFMFSDGRQCTMARSDIHPSLCVYHSEREEQLFGDPSAYSLVRGRTYDLPELFSAARDLSTAASVNRALAQIFRLLAQRRISRQEAAIFGHLAKLLLRTISLMAAEAEVQPEEKLPPVSSSLHEPQRYPMAHVASTRHSREASLSSSSVETVGDAGSSVKTPSAASVSNSHRINTSENAELKPLHNEHLHKNGSSAFCSSGGAADVSLGRAT